MTGAGDVIRSHVTGIPAVRWAAAAGRAAFVAAGWALTTVLVVMGCW
jgi:hypothetical protein